MFKTVLWAKLMSEAAARALPHPLGLADDMAKLVVAHARATIMTAKLHTPGRIIAIDLDDARLEKALEFGADVTINNGAKMPSRR